MSDISDEQLAAMIRSAVIDLQDGDAEPAVRVATVLQDEVEICVFLRSRGGYR